MNPLLRLGESVFAVVLHTSWQAAALAALILLTQRALGSRLAAGWRYGLWLLLVTRLLLPVSLPAPISVFNLSKLPVARLAAGRLNEISSPPPLASTLRASPPESPPAPRGIVERYRVVPVAVATPNHPDVISAPAPSQAGAARSAPAPAARTLDWWGIAVAVWLGGALLLGCRLLGSSLRFQRRLRAYLPVSAPSATQLLQECAAILGVRTAVLLLECAEVSAPAVCGLRRKKLLLPEGSLDRFTIAELRCIFLHELAHVKRRDLEVDCLVALLQVAHWFNPALWFAFARMRADRELAADALALGRAGDRDALAYGETILKVLEGLTRAPARPGLVGIGEDQAGMRERMRAIAGRGGVKTWRWCAAALALALAGLALTDAKEARPAEPAVEQPVEAPARPSGSPKSPAPPAAGWRRFAVRARDYDTTNALSNVTIRVELEYHGAPTRVETLTTGPDGRVAFDFLTTNLKRLGYHAQQPAGVSLDGDWHEQEITRLPDEFEIKLSQGVELGGIVTDEAGKPVSGAVVSFDATLNIQFGEGAPLAVRVWRTHAGDQLAVTDAAGNWRARYLYPTVRWAELRIHHPDFADFSGSTELATAMQAEGRGTRLEYDQLLGRRARFVMTEGETATGRVVGEDGQPISGVAIHCAEPSPDSGGGASALRGQRVVRSDADGRFQMAHVPSRAVVWWIQETGRAPVVVSRSAKAPNNPIELIVGPGRTVSGVVVDKEGNPISGAAVALIHGAGWGGVDWATTTDARGRFIWDHAPAKKFQLEIANDGYLTGRFNANAEGTSETTITLEKTMKITGRVIDARTKRPVERFLIRWLDRDDPRQLGSSAASVIPGSNGAYALDLGRLYARTWGGGYAGVCAFRIEADGYASTDSPKFTSRAGHVADASYDIELNPVPQIVGTVTDAAGNPARGAQVALEGPGSRLLLTGSPTFHESADGLYRVTDEQGRFRLNSDSTATGLIAIRHDGIAILGKDELAGNVTLNLRPWGRLVGTVREYGRPVTNQQVWVSAATSANPWTAEFRTEMRGDTDGSGHFSFDCVPTGDYSVQRFIYDAQGNGSSGPGTRVRVSSGATTSVVIGGTGRRVIGRFTIKNPYVSIDWGRNRDWLSISSVRPTPPAGLKSADELTVWQNMPAIKQALDAYRSYPARLAPDGSFTIEEMAPGSYSIRLQIYDPRDPSAFAHSRYLAEYHATFEVPADGVSGEEKPLDIGSFDVTLKPQIEMGRTLAPPFEATEMNGKKFALADFRGKYVVLDFWATWCGPCLAALPDLKKAQEKFGARPDFALVGLSLDNNIAEARDFLAKNDLPWTQGFLGSVLDGKTPTDYGVSGIPALFIINPDGKFVETIQDSASLTSTLEKYLK